VTPADPVEALLERWQEELRDDFCRCEDQLPRSLAANRVAVAFIRELADEDCAYGDDCPSFGTNHGRCLECKARAALSAMERALTGEE
jgi:hypothetical protein